MAQRPNWFIGWPFELPNGIEWGEVPPKVRRFAPTDLHITSVFLGAVDEAVAFDSWAALGDLPWSPFVASFGPIRMFGGRNPTAISATIDDGADRLIELIAKHRSVLGDAGWARPDPRPPVPHVTVARIQRSASHAHRDAALEWAGRLEVAASARIDRIALYTWSEDRTATLFAIKAERVADPSPDGG